MRSYESKDSCMPETRGRWGGKEKTELHRGSPSFYTKSPRSAEVRRGPPRSVSFYTRSRKSEKSEKFQEVMVRRPSSFASESSITTNPLAHAGENPLSYQAPLDR